VLPLSTLYRPENAFATLDEVRELADFTGLRADELVTFRPQRLVTHELLVRVAADISVPDGPGSEDLGVNFRHITATIAERHIAPRREALEQAYEDLRQEVRALARRELEPAFFRSSRARNASSASGARNARGRRAPSAW
jgi:hypothetical protein